MATRRSLSSRATLWRIPRVPAIIAGVVLLALFVGGWFAAHRGAKRLIEPLRWFGTVHYDAYAIGLGGDVEFTNLRVTPPRGGDLFVAQRARIDTPGLPWLMMAARHGTTRTDRASLAAFFGRENAPPDSVPAGFPAATAIKVTLDGAQFGPAVRGFADLQWLSLDVAAPFAEAGCGVQKPFTPVDLKAMRLPDSPLRVELDVARVDADQARIGARFAVDGVSSATLGMVVRWADPERLLDANWNQVVLLERHWDLVDEGLVTARNRWCARKLGVTRDEYISRHMDAVRARLAVYNATPGAEVDATYRRYLLRGGELHWRAAPSPAMALGQFGKFRPSEQLRILNASLEAVKGRAVRFAFSFVAPLPAPVAGDTAVATATAPDGTVVPTSTATTPATPTDGAAPAATTTAATTTSATTTPTATAGTAPAPNTGTITTPGAPLATAAATPAATSPPRTAAIIGDASAAAATPPRPPAASAPRIDPLATSPAAAPSSTPTSPAAAVASAPRVASLTPPDATGAERVVVQPPSLDELGDDIVYEDLEHYVGRRVVVRSRYNALRAGTLLKYTSVSITLRLEGRQQGLELSMPRQTVREVVSVTE